MATSSSLLDQFSLLIATSLGALQQDAQRKEIERALSTEPLSGVQPYELDLALRQIAYEAAQKIAADFVPQLKLKLKLELPPLPPPKEAPTVKDSEDVHQPEEPEPSAPEPQEPEPEEPQPQESESPVPEPPAPEPPAPEVQAPSAYEIGHKVTDQTLVAILADIGKCPNAFSFDKEEGGFRCQGKGHFVPDAEIEAEYKKRVSG
jgi:outer membrane biosynthesis protein TonB